DAFGVTQDTTHNFALTTAGTEVHEKCTAVARNIEAALGAAVYTGIQAFVGKNFFDKLVTHANVKDAYKTWQGIAHLQGASPRKKFHFGGIDWTEYRGSVTGSAGTPVAFVGDDDGYAFPVGVPGLFKTYFAPANYVETVNTIGLPRYAKAERIKFDKGVEGEMQTNPISICERPKVLQKLVKA
ncbi:MAG: major capsid protein, partial [Rhodospirillaceae bacterium]|nr:major capsid protein [Rhodospirillaceae bacterium]